MKVRYVYFEKDPNAIKFPEILINLITVNQSKSEEIKMSLHIGEESVKIVSCLGHYFQGDNFKKYSTLKIRERITEDYVSIKDINFLSFFDDGGNQIIYSKSFLILWFYLKNTVKITDRIVCFQLDFKLKRFLEIVYLCKDKHSVLLEQYKLPAIFGKNIMELCTAIVKIINDQFFVDIDFSWWEEKYLHKNDKKLYLLIFINNKKYL